MDERRATIEQRIGIVLLVVYVVVACYVSFSIFMSMFLGDSCGAGCNGQALVAISWITPLVTVLLFAILAVLFALRWGEGRTWWLPAIGILITIGLDVAALYWISAAVPTR